MWRPFGKKTTSVNIEKKSMVLGTSPELGSFLIFGHSRATTAASALSLYSDSTAVSIPVNMIAEAFASIEPVIKVKKDGKDVIIRDHPVLDLLKVPSPFFTQDLFMEVLGKHYLITNNAYVVALGNVNLPPIELQPMSPSNANDIEGKQGFVQSFSISGNTLAGNYLIDKNNGRIRYFDGSLKELKQIRGFSVRNNSLLRGQSVLVSASAEVRQHIMGNTHNVSLLENGGRISLVFNFDEDLSDDDFRTLKERVISQYGGAPKAGTIGVTSGGKLKIEELGTSNLDMDFVNLQMMAKQAVALQYKVPLPLVTIQASTFNNYREAKLALFDDAVLPLADRIYAGLTDLLMPRFGIDPVEEQITYDLDTITALAIRRNEELKLRRELNLESLNELRAVIGRENVTGGDQILAPATMIPIGNDIFTQDNIQAEPEPGLLRDEQSEPDNGE